MNKEAKAKKILVVDDDPTQVKLLKERLEEKCFVVLTATEAPEGLQMAIDHAPNLIILDVMMPVINGYNFCKLLKNEEKHSKIPILLLTCRDKEEDLQIGMEMGANAYLTKPVHFEELFEEINRLI